MPQSVLVPRDSRYKDTPVYADPFGTVFALMEPPVEFVEPRPDEKLHTVTRAEVGMLDHLAVRYWGPSFERFWWVIGLVNRLIDPDQDMRPGQVLRVPSRATVMEFISRVGDA